MNPVIKNKNNYKNPILSIEDKVGDYVMLYVVHKKGKVAQITPINGNTKLISPKEKVY